MEQATSGAEAAKWVAQGYEDPQSHERRLYTAVVAAQMPSRVRMNLFHEVRPHTAHVGGLFDCGVLVSCGGLSAAIQAYVTKLCKL